mmetsp:Transcript_22969/g.28191  ORF Transcript_22969/g.28191 Transcript_22969/m.28191 type:complete len:315 (+) Transcript_22969:145-1089(+)
MFLENCINLKKISVRRCDCIVSLQGIEKCSQLESLVLSSCPDLKDFSPMSKCENLKSLHVKRADIQDLAVFGYPRTLQSLHLMFCNDLKEIKNLHFFPCLIELFVHHCSGIETIDCSSSGTSFKVLEVSHCLSFKFQSTAGEDCKSLLCPSLTRVELSFCGKITGLQGLEKASSLKTLEIRNCSGLEDISSVCSSPSLERLILSNCCNLKELGPLGNCTTLKELSITACHNLNLQDGNPKLLPQKLSQTTTSSFSTTRAIEQQSPQQQHENQNEEEIGSGAVAVKIRKFSQDYDIPTFEPYASSSEVEASDCNV